MPNVRLQNGRVLTRNGRVLCECCDLDFTASFGDFGQCDCATVLCYDAITKPSPATRTIGGITYTNRTPNTNKFDLGGALASNNSVRINYPIVTQTGGGSFVISGWQNFTANPSIVRLTGAVGGDIELWMIADVGSPYPSGWNSSNALFGVIPHEGQYPCGTCDVPRNGPHPINYTFILYPNTYAWIAPVSYLDCFPWLRLRLTRVRSLAP